MHSEKLDQLNSSRSKLVDQLINTNRNGGEASGECDRLLGHIKALDVEIQREKRLIKLKQVNGEQSRLRDLARIAWEVERPDSDITCADGSFHATKIRKYPKLAAIKWCRATFSQDGMTELCFEGRNFLLCRKKYTPTEKYPKLIYPETFEEFLDLNGIESKDITIEQFDELILNLNSAREALEKAADLYSKSVNLLNAYQYQNIGLIRSSQMRAQTTFLE